MDTPSVDTFLCGMVAPGSDSYLTRGIIQLRDENRLSVVASDPGLRKIKAGRRCMVIVRNGRILAVFRRPRINLIRLIEGGVPMTRKLLSDESPAYLQSEATFYK